MQAAPNNSSNYRTAPTSPLTENTPFIDRTFKSLGFIRLTIGQVGNPHEAHDDKEGGTRRYLPGINLIIAQNADIVADLAATKVLELFAQPGEKILGTATGKTMEGIYKLVLSRMHPSFDLSGLKTRQLDEYVGIPPWSPQSYRYELGERLKLLMQFGFDLDRNLNTPRTWDGVNNRPKSSEQLREECQRYNQLALNPPPHLQLLGIGTEGHLAFCEKGTDPDEGTHLVNLAQSTILSNAEHFGGDIGAVPRQAVTMGIKTLGDMANLGTQFLVIATGAHKAAAVQSALFGPISSNCPASFSRLWSGVTFIVDRAAAGPLGELLGDA